LGLVALFLCAGAVVNVLVAWGCMWFAPQVERWSTERRGGLAWCVTVPSDWPTVPKQRVDYHGLGWRERIDTWTGQRLSEWSLDVEWCQVKAVTAGLPLASMMHASWRSPTQASGRMRHDWRSRWAIEMPGEPPSGLAGSLPALPLWFGFVFDSVVFAGVLFSFIKSPTLVRRATRRRRGQCVGCGYSLAGLGVDAACPECGREKW
jgi:hypothetical protein